MLVGMENDLKPLLLVAPLIGAVWLALALDLWCRRVPNIVTFTVMAMGISLQTITGAGNGLLTAVAGVGVGLMIFLPGYILGGTGAGDVKLSAAIGAFLGPYWILVAGILSILVGSLIAAAFALSTLLSRSATAPWPRYKLMLQTMVCTGRVSYVPPAEGEVMGRKFPFAVSIAIGTTLTLVLWWPALSAQWAG